ncbi:hypothetical protein [Nitrospira sp. Kam-Ns4a]
MNHGKDNRAVARIACLVSGLGWLAFTTSGFVIEILPRISDREIIERLPKLEEGQAHSRAEMNQRFGGDESSLWHPPVESVIVPHHRGGDLCGYRSDAVAVVLLYRAGYYVL